MDRFHIQDAGYENRIAELYTLFLYVDFYALQKQLNTQKLSLLPISVYLLYRHIRKLNTLNRKIIDQIRTLTRERMEEGYVNEKLRGQAVLENIAVLKIECLQRIDHYVGQCTDQTSDLMEHINEKYDY